MPLGRPGEPDARSVHATLLLDAGQGTDQGCPLARHARAGDDREAAPSMWRARPWVVGRERRAGADPVRPSAVVNQSRKVETYVQRN
jgi:hypothetical protein